MSYVRGLKCRECGREFGADERIYGRIYVCDNCFGPLEVNYDFSSLSPEGARRRIKEGPPSLWRYSDFLPFEARPDSALHAGMTPLLRADTLAGRLGLKKGNVWVKNDAANRTHSFKDRPVVVALEKARDLKYAVVACASTGNLANAVAAYASAAGLKHVVFVPADLEEEKILATGAFGGKVVKVDGTYDDVSRVCSELAADKEDWAFVNLNMRHFYREGSKTMAYEIAEQLEFRLPDRVVVPIASGALFTEMADGFKEWLKVGLVEGDLPVFNGAQAAGCAPVAEAFSEGRDVCRPVKRPETIAKSLAIGDPADGAYAIRVARATGGSIDMVDEDEIRAGVGLLAETTGVFTEAAGGVTVAVFNKLVNQGEIDPDETVVLAITGDGLKTPDAGPPVETVEVAASAAAFVEAIDRPAMPAGAK